MPEPQEPFTLARVHSIDHAEGEAWVEMVQGNMTLHPIEELPEDEVHALVHIGLSTGVLLPAPAGSVWPRIARTVGTLRAASSIRALMEIGGAVRALDPEVVVDPSIGSYYFFDEQMQMWHPLTDDEAKILDTETADVSPFNVENLEPSDGGTAAFGGMRETFDELVRLVEGNFAARQSLGNERLKTKPAAGAIFFGPPGTGKTHLARSVAEQLGASLTTVNGPELLDKWLGSTEKAFRELFRVAQESPRSIIFIDEFDTIGSRRGPEVHEAINRQVGQLLSLMDGAVTGPRPFVIAATNRLEDVDPAFLRPGRFDFPVEFRHPSSVERLQILEVQTRDLAIEDRACLSWLAEASDGWTPAELGLIWSEADLSRSTDNRSAMTLEDVVAGFERARQQHSIIERNQDAIAAKAREQ